MSNNTVTLDSTGQVIRYGTSDFFNDGTFDGGTQTFHTNVGKQIEGVPLKHTKVSGGVLTEMTAPEKAAVDATTSPDIITARTLRERDSGAYSVSQTGAAYVITLPAAVAGISFKFVLIAESAFSVTIRAASTHLYGNYNAAGTPTQINAQTDIIFDSTDANIGDTISMDGVDSTCWNVIGATTHVSGLSTA